MRSLSPAFAAALQSDATTLCHCWRLTRRDGVIMGFTDHDRDVVMNATVCQAATGLDASQAHATLGLSVDGGEVQGALDAQSLTETDLARGLYDDASVEIWIVDWSDPTRCVLMDIATIGEVRRADFSFVAELRSLSHRFDEERGRCFQRACSADLGDARCRVILDDPAFATTGTVVSVMGAHTVLVMLDTAFANGFFTGGTLTPTSGAYAGTSVSLRSDTQTAAGHVLGALAGPISQLAAGDRVSVVAGCDKSPETCLAKFDNITNFRGFPHMPGNDVLMSYANANAPTMDGGSLFR